MATLHLTNLSPEIINELRERAQHFHRPVEEEAASILVNAITFDRWRGELSADQLIDKAAKVRQGHPHAFLSEEFLRAAKNDGRP
ncbi:MAG: hypothetical protein ABSC42_08150 [Tepidisphaeraceae bacterium]